MRKKNTFMKINRNRFKKYNDRKNRCVIDILMESIENQKIVNKC